MNYSLENHRPAMLARAITQKFIIDLVSHIDMQESLILWHNKGKVWGTYENGYINISFSGIERMYGKKANFIIECLVKVLKVKCFSFSCVEKNCIAIPYEDAHEIYYSLGGYGQ